MQRSLWRISRVEQRVFSSKPTRLQAQANIKPNHFLLIFFRMWHSYGTTVLDQWVSTEYWWIGIGPAYSNKSRQSGAGQMGSREFITARLVECRLALTADNLPSTQSSKPLSYSPRFSTSVAPVVFIMGCKATVMRQSIFLGWWGRTHAISLFHSLFLPWQCFSR